MSVILSGVAGPLIQELGKGSNAIKAFSKDAQIHAGKAQKHINSIGANVKNRVGPSLVKMGGILKTAGGMAVTWMRNIAISAGAAATAIGYFSLRMIDAVGDSSDMAKRLGLSYNKLKAIQYAAKLAGIDSEKLNSAFERMQDVLGNASIGEKSAIDALARIGLSMEQLNRLRPEQRFEAIGNAIAQIQDPAQRIAAARDIFGKQGGALLVLFENAGQAISDAADKMQQFGVALSELDLANIERAGDSMDMLNTILEGLGIQLAANISPYIEQLGIDTEKWIKEMGGVEGIVDTAFAKLDSALGWILNKTDYLVVGWEKLAGLWDKVPDWVKKGIGFNPIRDYAMDGITEGVEKRRAERGGLKGRFGAFADRAKQNAYDKSAEAAIKERDERKAANAAARQQAEQARAQEIMRNAQRRGFVPSAPLGQANRTPFANQSMGGGGYSEELNLLRQIAQNTGMNSVAYVGN
jgi:hypothetical protein